MASGTKVTTPSSREIVVKREFAAPAVRLFGFLTQASHVRGWLLGPPGWTMPVCDIDLRVGGGYRYVWRNESCDAEFGVSGAFREIDCPNRLVHTERMDGTPGVVLCTVTLVDHGGGTVLTNAMLFPTEQIRDLALQSGMTDGMAASYERLGAELAALFASP